MDVLRGIPACFTSFASVIKVMPNASGGLVSANALFKQKRGTFRHLPPGLFCGIPMALDSAGFVAMVHYLFYRWTLDQYVELAGSYPWIWWAAPDFSCEGEITRDQSEVLARVEATAAKLAWALVVARGKGVKPCMPVLQGWQPDDYLRCADMISRFTTLPALIGLGSMCRLHVHGSDGAVAIVERLDTVLPANICFHLFGVKGDAAMALRGHSRIRSADSQAFEARTRREANERRKENPSFTCTLAFRTANMRRWHANLVSQLAASSPRAPSLSWNVGFGDQGTIAISPTEWYESSDGSAKSPR